MKLSVITACRNSVNTIRETIDSVRSQSYPDIEHIICDGASTDGTIEAVESYNGMVKLIYGPDKGIYDAMNKGIRAATGDVIAILNSEDFYTNNQVIQKVVDKFQEHDADAVYGDLFYVDSDDTNKVIRYWKTGRFTQHKFLDGWMMPHPALFMKKQLYERYGYYRDEFQISGDYEMILRVFMRNPLVVRYVEEVLVKMRMGGASNNSILSRFIANKEDRLAWKINNLVPHPLTLIFKPLRKIGQFFWKTPTPVVEVNKKFTPPSEDDKVKTNQPAKLEPVTENAR